MLFFFAFVGMILWVVESIGELVRSLLGYWPILVIAIGLMVALMTAVALITITVVYRAVQQSRRWRAVKGGRAHPSTTFPN